MDRDYIINSPFFEGEKLSDFKINKILDLYNKIENENPFYEIDFTYEDEVKPAPRPRGAIRGKILKRDKFKRPILVQNPVIHWYDPGSDDKKVIRDFVSSILPEDFELIEGEIFVNIKVYKKMLKNFTLAEEFLAEEGIIRPDKKPDTDNYAKTVMDAINELIWKDDGSVVDLHMEKYYSVKPRTEVYLRFRDKKSINK